jgi:hypothetical protein
MRALLHLEALRLIRGSTSIKSAENWEKLANESHSQRRLGSDAVDPLVFSVHLVNEFLRERQAHPTLRFAVQGGVRRLRAWGTAPGDAADLFLANGIAYAYDHERVIPLLRHTRK